MTMNIRACLFDMDGLLINSEQIYTDVANEILAEHGKGPLPWEIKKDLQGRPGPEAARVFLEWSGLPYNPDEYYAMTSARQSEKWQTCKFMPGALELLKYLKEKDIPFALATSSHRGNFEKKTAHLGHGFELFGDHIVVGDDERIPKGRGKPNPDIWQVALKSLNDQRHAGDQIKPNEVLVFEDGIPGVVSGRAAEAHVIWVPDQRLLNVLKKGEAQEIIGNQGEILTSLADLDKTKYGL
ncbi:HAD-like domain-containing protein [Yarrowia lipolytica]|uniref:YALI0F25025p n=2 Tax=Yarrowia lipolytica TaxID=4952 RepID=Q6C0G1_YARLI|nr:YALI0F25025p [Yarrowia lipolytica CLIB122]RDW27704.1 HAD-like domain-containing protein [Yarrowia lipolytica]RDW41920.1 HAD-like domain-containing protein [Yarrowia lipolytica]RDW44747.1 HAD-like domain-containing protein [Yarrowia lipolytica]RDW51618.1 HAD-like domain-containing protein [Yarrowia lipolytica]CAG78662.1 YALI0F25025p [Yarrowia lipolytica CLIB122]|eukprot:XP_505851.1 YALI0F25025p [Yarrowia lipolytica CLIB122]